MLTGDVYVHYTLLLVRYWLYVYINMFRGQVIETNYDTKSATEKSWNVNAF